MTTVPESDGPVGAGDRPRVTALLCRGVRRMLSDHGYRSVTEFRLATGRRADIMAIDRAGRIVIVEIKSGMADFRADGKWPDYRSYCDAFYFAVAPSFPAAAVPEMCGLMVADGFGAEILREPPAHRLAPARRRALTLALALAAAGRLHRIEDPSAAIDAPE